MMGNLNCTHFNTTDNGAYNLHAYHAEAPPQIRSLEEIRSRFTTKLNHWVLEGMPGENRHEAAKRIQQCFDANEVFLELSQCNQILAALPNLSSDSRRQLLADNGYVSLESLQQDLESLNTLANQIQVNEEGVIDRKALVLDGLGLTALPDVFRYLQELTKLSFAGNLLESVPDSVNLLLKLESFNCANNKITEPPLNARLSELRDYNCSHNWLSTFYVVNFPRLRTLDCSHNCIPEAPVFSHAVDITFEPNYPFVATPLLDPVVDALLPATVMQVLPPDDM